MKAVEAMVARECIEALIAAGYYITVNDGEEDTDVKHSRDPEAIFGAMSTTDEDYLLVFDGPRLVKGTKQTGWVRFIYGNDGWDVINDYHTGLEPVMSKVNVVVDKLSDGGADAVIDLYKQRDTAHKELASLRLSVRRIAEVLDHDTGGLGDPAFAIPEDSDERGWNALCSAICDRIENNRRYTT